jgi:malonyl-CoA reductase / 3-hydroxypropionate dehydrogenase (NADP+)
MPRSSKDLDAVSDTPKRKTPVRPKAVSGSSGRLAGKIALITGAAGNIGETITRRFLEEGATVVMVGRNRAKLEDARKRLLKRTKAASEAATVLPFDAADPGQVRWGIESAMQQFGRLDIVVNNAGSAGPKQTLEDVPLTRDELELLRAQGSSDTETARDAAGNLLGLSWNVVRAVVPHLKPGATIIHVSTIFSRTQYYGRAAYVLPKAALNGFSRQLALQLGPKGIRVNTVFPGPIESERIRTVFAAMDGLRQAPDGTTNREMTSLMTLNRQAPDGTAVPLPTVEDVANAIVFLGSDESAALNGHHLEITHGMTVRQESRSTWVSRPELRTVDGTGITILVAAGDQVADALTVARIQSGCGANVLLGLGSEEGVQAAQAALQPDDRDRRIIPVLFDRRRPETLSAVLTEQRAREDVLHGAIVMPAFGAWRFHAPLAEATDADVDAFLTAELCGALAIARELTRFWKTAAPRGTYPRTVFLSNGTDGGSNAYGDILRAAMEELVRIWRDESDVQVKMRTRKTAEWSNQLIRWTNAENEGLPFAASQAARLLYTKRRINQVNLYLPPSIVDATGSHKTTFGWIESLMGLHLGKTALITGGSAGIGGQLGRLLAIAGARVMLTARREDQLREMRDGIIRELEDIGYYRPQERVLMMADVDAGDEAALATAVSKTMAEFGRIDFLVNNAGIAGAEQMVVDMDPDAWRTTLQANLTSNYSLIEKVVPFMKRQGSGYILNVSSYFGGEKYIAVPYPNRADYAVSKAGQRALVENLARFVGPEVQINAIAPGPVDGQRLAGKDGKAGLFARRARLIHENKRLNLVHAAVLTCLDSGTPLADLLVAMQANDLATLAASDAPAPLRDLGSKLAGGNDADAQYSSVRALLTPAIARRFVDRLAHGGVLLDAGAGAAEAAEAWLRALPVPPEPFLNPQELTVEAEKIQKGVLGMLHLRHMPSETDVALATVFFMADSAISGETFEPSGGLHQERTITERELFGRAKPERLRRMEGDTVWVIGEHLHEQMAGAIRLFLAEAHVGTVVVLARTGNAEAGIRAGVGRALGHDRVIYRVVGDALEDGMDAAYREHGKPSAVVSTPFTPIPRALFGVDGRDHLDAGGFGELVEGNLTHHFRVARKVSLYKGTRVILVSPDVPVGGTPAQFAMANFVKTTLHALTATLGVENERLYTNVPVNQVNLTRRMRSEEPRDAAEQAEEIERFSHAVLLAAAPLPEEKDSRYKARIYRGLAITV